MKKIIYISAAIAVCLCSCGNKLSIQSNGWDLTYQNGINVYHAGNKIASGIYAEYNIGNTIVNSKDYPKRKFETQNLKDQFGKGKKWTITYTSQERPTLTQTFRIYKAFSFKLQPKLWFLVWALVARLMFPRCSSLVHQFLITWSSRDRLKGIAEL